MHHKKNILPLFISFLAGCLLPFAFAPFHFYPLAFISLALYAICLQSGSRTQGFLRGWIYGIGFFGIGASWVYNSLHIYGHMPGIIAGLFTFFFILILGLFIALQGLLTRFCCNDKSFVRFILAFSGSWVLLEWLRTIFFTGFPWLLISYSQTNSPLKGYIPIVGDYGLAFIIAIIAALFSSVPAKNLTLSKKISCIIVIALIISAGPLLSKIVWVQQTKATTPITIIQGNIAQDVKWNPTHIQHNIDTYWELTKHYWKPGIIIWPENTIPYPKQIINEFINEIDIDAKKNNITFITGIPVRASKNYYYNSILVLGKNQGHYYKRRLVPFGEFIPFEYITNKIFDFFKIPMSNFVPGKTKQSLIEIDNIKIAPFICYEIAYSSLILKDLPAANLLLILSDDSWFGDSIAANQHLQIAKFRAIETGRYTIFATNSGPSAIINQNGRIISIAPKLKQAVIQQTIRAYHGTTPWIALGNWPFILLAGVLVVIGGLSNFKGMFSNPKVNR